MYILSIVAFVIGLVLLLFSRKIYESAIFLMGAVIGFLISVGADYSLQVVSSGLDYSPNWLLILIVTIVCGVLARFIHSLMIFLLGFSLGIMLTIVAGMYVGSDFPWIVIGLVCGIPLGFLALKAEKFFFILITTFIAANILVIDVYMLLAAFGILGEGHSSPGDYYSTISLVLILIVTVSGVLYQFGSHKERQSEEIFLADTVLDESE